MKRWFMFFLCLLMLSMSVTVTCADSVTVTAHQAGYEHLLFSSGYYGFCVDEGLDGAEVGDSFTVAPASDTCSNGQDARDVSHPIKVMLTEGFHHFFAKGEDGRYAMTADGQWLAQRMIWCYTDQYVRVDEKQQDIDRMMVLVEEWLTDARTVPDNGYRFSADEETDVTLDFALYNTRKEGQQCFFAYQITQHEVKGPGSIPGERPDEGNPDSPTDIPTDTPTDPPILLPDPTPPMDDPVHIPQTGDHTSVAVSGLLLAVCAVGFLFLSKNRK